MYVTKINDEEFRLDKALGYMYTYKPEHELANKAGKVYQHTYVMVQHIQRKLTENEEVHHKDRVRSNNNISNLQLLTSSEHRKLHCLEAGQGTLQEYTCNFCKRTFKAYSGRKQKFCSKECAVLSRRKFNLTAEEMQELVWKYPTTVLAKLLGVSDTAVAKRCKKLGVSKPPRGYWSKPENNYIVPFQCGCEKSRE